MRILVTNDDGYDAPGLLALVRALGRLDDIEFDIVAPRLEQSGHGHTVSAKVLCRPTEVSGLGRVIVVEGTPADCVRIALNPGGQPRPDWVIAGINRGGNLGVDVYYSGTIAAAREAAIIGIPALALSQFVKPELPDDWERTTREAAAVVAGIIRPDQPAPAGADREIHEQTARLVQGCLPSADGAVPCWNVNLPRLPPGQPPTGVHIVPLSTDPVPVRYDSRYEGDGTQCLTYTGDYQQRFASAGTDVACVFAGGIAISPMRI